ncbi:MAG: mannose-1-phosphate guanylyltransferase/mannose-6-phosphate isomerase [Candidatus Omnitrophica bacterium]|nr:mannose-1-phosphate guanylyltransferase/mannose-6-phosphate isomerase [Candidatus Omnitrophota bacterium]
MKAVVLAGGKGTRLWPLSRINYPKQFVEFLDGKSLFQITLERVLNTFNPYDVFISSHQDYKFHIFNQIDSLRISQKEKDYLKRNLILEPKSKSTLPSVLTVLKYLEDKVADDELFFVFPSDHIIKPLNRFKACLKKAGKLASLGYLVTFGVKPTALKEGYGYILLKKRLRVGYLVDRFVEKPKGRRLHILLRKGALWNAGIFSFKKSVFIEEVKRYQLSLFRIYRKNFSSFLKEFSRMPSISIDYGIMEKTKKACVVKFNLRWSDLGNWESFWEFFKDRKSNATIGKGVFFDSQSCFSFSKERLIVGVGLKDTIIVEAPDTVLVLKKSLADRMKEVVKFLKEEKEVKDSLTVYRPWGYYTILKEAGNYKVKEIGIYPKKYISLQRHKFRSEHWNVVEGKIEVILKNKKINLKRNESIFVPKREKHRLYNPTNKIAKVIEVQIGTYLGEDDIERFDSY